VLTWPQAEKNRKPQPAFNYTHPIEREPLGPLSGVGQRVEEKPKIGGKPMSITMKQMLEAGLHFGHQTRRWNPKMKPYIFAPRNGIYIINLDKSIRLFRKAYDYVVEETAKGGVVLFVGTKRQGQAIIKEEASRCGMPYIDHRWLGGSLTNFHTIKKGVERLKSIEAMQEDGSINRFPKKEILLMEKERVKLERNIGGIKNMRSLPAAVFVIDPNKEQIAVKEANKLNIPVIALADTNCDPDGIDIIIPGNDDAIRAIKLITSAIADAVLDGRSQLREKDAVVEEMVEQAMAENPEELADDMESEGYPADEE
jgi:small subunit ribosomal protein S2